MRTALREKISQRLRSVSVLHTLPEPPLPLPSCVIATHNGTFHCDEALACGLLLHAPPFVDAVVLRTRTPGFLEKAQAVVDVGCVYDPGRLRLDHHQPEFQDTFRTAHRGYATRLSSAGLVYRHFGKSLLKSYCEEYGVRLENTEKDLELLYDRVYRHFIEHIDGNDNGVDPFQGKPTANYFVPSSLPARVARLNPRWNEESGEEVVARRFTQAMELTCHEFFEAVEQVCASWFPARALVREAVMGAAEVHPSGRVLKLSAGGLPWKDHLFDLEEELALKGRFLYVLFQDTMGEWRVMAVPETQGGFSSRKALPWKGLRDEELSRACHVEGCVFVHASGFIGGNKTEEGIMKMTNAALESTS